MRRQAIDGLSKNAGATFFDSLVREQAEGGALAAKA